MVNKKKLSKLTISELKEFRSHILYATTKEELLEALDTVLEQKETELSQSLNSRFLVDWMNIDFSYKQILYENGINTESQLLGVQDLRDLKGMTEGAYEQISWARTFFDMSPVEEISPEERTTETLTKVFVKQANETSHRNN